MIQKVHIQLLTEANRFICKRILKTIPLPNDTFIFRLRKGDISRLY